MSEEEQKKLSRRAQRRAAREKEAAEDSEDCDDEADEADEADEEESEDRDESEDDESEDRDESEEEDDKPKVAAKSSKPSKTEKKRSKQARTTEQIRDRNKRMREQAAQKRRTRRERERTAEARGLDTSEMVDDALARTTHVVVTFAKRHFNVIQWVIVLGIAGGIGWQIYAWRSHKSSAKASDLLMAAVNAEFGTVGDEAEKPELEAYNLRPTFPTEAARLEAAMKSYDQTIADRPGSGTAILAELGKAGILYDQAKYAEAATQYESVKNSALAKNDPDVRLRAVEGVGLSLEAKGDLDGAARSYKELETATEPGFSALGMYHQARLLVQKGEKDKAEELLTKLTEKISKEASPAQMGSYLAKATRELQGVIDPSKVPPTPSYTPDQMQALQQQILKDPAKLQKMLKDMGKMKAPELPTPEAPDPEEEPPVPMPPSSQ